MPVCYNAHLHAGDVSACRQKNWECPLCGESSCDASGLIMQRIGCKLFFPEL